MLFVLALTSIAILGSGISRLIFVEMTFSDTSRTLIEAKRETEIVKKEMELRSVIEANAELLLSLTERIHAPTSKAEEARYLQASAQKEGVRLTRLEQRDKNEAGQDITTIEVGGRYANTKKWLQKLSLAPTIWVIKEIRIVKEQQESSDVMTQVKLLSYGR
jgi:hypothetical protein